MTTTTAPPTAPSDEAPPPPAPLALLRNTWRGLTSMRTALVLLFLLALAALPGALLPQRSLNQRLVTQYFTDHPTLAPLLDKLQFFGVFAAPWFAAIYLLLMVSLVGCVLPRTVEHARALRSPMVATPRNLARLPHSAAATLPVPVAEVEARVRGRLRRWRGEWRADGDVRTVSAERGRLREVGNLVFHLSLLGVLVAFAAGKLFGYEGQVIVMAGGGQFCNTGILGYDSFRPGLRVDGTELVPFCVRVDDFAAAYEPNGQPASFRATVGYQTATDLAGGVDTWRSTTIAVNHPLRTDGSRVYLLGHGYAPRFTVTWPDGAQRTGEVQWRPVDQSTLLSEGATKFARPGVTDAAQRRTSQLAVTGLLAPTSSGGQVVSSVFPALEDPEVAVDVLRGDLGLDDGRGQSIFTVDRGGLDNGTLTRVARKNLRPGEEITLDDGTRVRFDGVRDWVSLQVSHDPAEGFVLASAVLLLAGLLLSLTVRRRRFWARLTPLGDGETRVELGGLARTDRAGYGEEFDRLRAELLLEDAPVNDPVINPVLALYSDRLFMAAVGVYVLAMVLHAAEYALARTARAADPVASVPATVGALTSTGAAGSVESAVGRNTSDEGAARRTEPMRSRADRIGGAAVNLVVLGAVLQLAAVVTRGLATDRWPLGNMYEFTSVFCLAAVVTWLVVLRRAGSGTGLRPVGLFVLLPVVILLFLAGTVLYARAAPVVPALRSYWLIVHVTTITTSSGLLIVPGVASLLHLLRSSGHGGGLAERLPSAAALDRLAYRVTIVAFPLYTFGVIAGAVWAEAAWGRFWGWDPKETVAFVAWVVYAAYLHARATAGWRAAAPWINVVGLAAVLFNLFFINMVVAGLHSYAGLG